MSTRIVFGGGSELNVSAGLEEVKSELQKEATGRRLLKFKREGRGDEQDREVYVNPAEVAYISRGLEKRHTETEEPPDFFAGEPKTADERLGDS